MRPDGVKLIYLDLNHWVALAKAAVGHPEGSQHVGALETLRAAKASGRYVLPLSSTHFMELSAVKNRRHRVDVADVMEELTGFTVIVSRDVIMRLELEAALDAFGRPRPTPYLPVDLLGRGVLRAFGKIGGLRIRNTDGVDVTDSVRTQWPRGADNFDEWQEKGERLLDRSVLRGPADAEEEAKLRADSWDPMVARRIANERAVQEAEQADRVADKAHWRGQRGRDVAAERHMIIDLNEALSEGLSDRGLTREDVLLDSESSRRFTSADCAFHSRLLITATPRPAGQGIGCSTSTR